MTEPMAEWVDYAKRSGLLDENGVAPDSARAQTAWNAFTFAWNAARATARSECCHKTLLADASYCEGCPVDSVKASTWLEFLRDFNATYQRPPTAEEAWNAAAGVKEGGNG